MKGENFDNSIAYEEKITNNALELFNDNEGFIDKSTSSYKCFIKRVDGLITLKFEKEFNVSLLNFLSLIYEIEYFPKWFPFVKLSKLVK